MHTQPIFLPALCGHIYFMWFCSKHNIYTYIAQSPYRDKPAHNIKNVMHILRHVHFTPQPYLWTFYMSCDRMGGIIYKNQQKYATHTLYTPTNSLMRFAQVSLTRSDTYTIYTYANLSWYVRLTTFIRFHYYTAVGLA